MTSTRRPRTHVVLGLERLLGPRLDLVRDARVGLVCNQATVDHSLRHAADLVHAHPKIRLTTLFGPQHGIRGDVQDNMVETAHATDRQTGLPVYSLYSETRDPTEAMLKDVDVLVVDLQDVGCRIYTFVYTMANCMRVARALGKKVIVCDRPNPIGGEAVAGNVLDPAFASFVGLYPIPTRHGLTSGELARLFNETQGIGCDLEVVPMEGWARAMWMDDTDAPWVLPSPNMPTLDTASVFPGTVHLEGTQMSEGRGTTRPFELVGAPWLDPWALARDLGRERLPGVAFRPLFFTPTFHKYAGRPCGGVQVHVTDRDRFPAFLGYLLLLHHARRQAPPKFAWRDPPYEYEYVKRPIDILCGTSDVRRTIDEGYSPRRLAVRWRREQQAFRRRRAPYLLY